MECISVPFNKVKSFTLKRCHLLLLVVAGARRKYCLGVMVEGQKKQKRKANEKLDAQTLKERYRLKKNRRKATRANKSKWTTEINY